MSGIISSCALVLVLLPLPALSYRDTVTIRFNSSSVSVAEGSYLGIQLIAQGTYDQGFTVNLTFQDETARLLQDYIYPGYPTVTPSVIFSPGSLSSSVFNVIAIGNNAFDPGQRRFTVRYELPDVPGLRLRRGRPDRLSVSITDDDFVAVSFERPSQEVIESIGSIPVQLKSRGFYSRPFQVFFTCVEVAPVEAKNGSDFISKMHTVTFKTAGTQETMSTEASIPILDDKIQEPTESFFCIFLRPHRLDGIVVEGPNTVSFAILDDDKIEMRFEHDAYTGEEGTTVTNIRLISTDFADPFKVQIFVFTLDADATEKEVEAEFTVDYRDPQTLVGSGVVSFDPALGLISSILSIPLFSDNIAEGTEYFGLTFVAVTDETEDNPIEITPVDPTQVLVAIQDTNEIFVRVSTCRKEVSEDGQSADIYFEVVHEESPGMYVPAEYTFDFNVTVAAVGGSAIAKKDNVTFVAGKQFSTPFTVSLPDSSSEFTVRYSIIQSSVRSGATVSQLDTEVTVYVNGNDTTTTSNATCSTIREHTNVTKGVTSHPTVTVLFNSSKLSAIEGGNVGIQLIAQGIQEHEFKVNLTFHDGNARLLHDYLYLGYPDVTPSVTFAPGSLSSSVFNVIAIANNAFDEQRSFSVRFELPNVPGLRLRQGRPDRFSVFIADDDFVVVSFERPSQEVIESIGSIPVQLKSKGFYIRPFQVSFTCVEATPVEAENGADFISKVHTVTFNATRRLETMSTEESISILDDKISEPTESFICFILRPYGLDGIVVEHPNIISYAILDDDDFEVRFEQDSYIGVEGSSITNIRLLATEFTEPFKVQIFVFTLDSDAPEKEVEADINVDYRDPQTLVESGVVSFDPALGLVSSPLTIPLFSDNIAEGTEYFGLTFVAVTDENEDNPIDIIPVEPIQVLVAINDTNEIFVRLNTSRIQVVEDGRSVDVYFKVVREESPGVYVPAEYIFDFNLTVTTVGGSATADADFVDKTDTVRFSAGEQYSSPFTITINEDTVSEGPEEFTVSYSIVGSSVREGATVSQLDTTATIVIIDKIFLQFEREEYVIDEDGGNIEVRLVVQSGTVYQPFNVTVELVDGTATDLQDAVLIDIFATFQVNDITSSIVNLAILEDFILEGNEMFTIKGELSSETAAFVEILPPNSKVNIRDNDILSVSLTTPDLTVTEGTDSEVILTVITDIVAAFPFHVNLIPVNRTAENGNDFTAADPIRVDFAAFKQSVSVSFPLINDSVVEPMERFRVELEVPSEFTTRNVTVGENLQTTVNINDDDCVTVTITTDKVDTAEGSNLPLTVMADGDFSEAFEVVITMTDGTATGGADFDDMNLNIHFEPSGAKSQEREVETLGDDLNEVNEWFVVTLSRVSSTSMCYKIENGTLNMTIEDDDGITIYFQQEEYSVEEGTNLSVHLNISGHIQYPFTVEVLPCSQLNGTIPDTKIPDGANKATVDDFSRAPVPVTFQPGMLVSTIAVIDIVNDDLLEGPKLFELCFPLDKEEENRKITPGDPESAVVTITDDPPNSTIVVGFLKRRMTNSEGHLVSLNVSRSGNMDREMHLNAFSQSSFSSAKEGTDYELLTQELVFSRVDTLYEEQTVTLRLVKDDLPELKEHFFLSLETLEGVVYHSQHVAVFIEDVDHKRSCVIKKTDTIPYVDLICA